MQTVWHIFPYGWLNHQPKPTTLVGHHILEVGSFKEIFRFGNWARKLRGRNWAEGKNGELGWFFFKKNGGRNGVLHPISEQGMAKCCVFVVQIRFIFQKHT